MSRDLRLVVGTALLLCTYAAQASEIITYTYDARGRLIKVGRSGTVNNGLTACYAHDRADNRINVTAASTNCSATVPPSAGGAPVSSYSITDAAGAEGEVAVFTVTRTASGLANSSVNFATGSGTASTSDYGAQSSTLTFLPGELSKSVSVTLRTDSLTEGTETFYVNLSGATGGATIADGQGVGSIENTDNPCPLCIAPPESDPPAGTPPHEDPPPEG